MNGNNMTVGHRSSRLVSNPFNADTLQHFGNLLEFKLDFEILPQTTTKL